MKNLLYILIILAFIASCNTTKTTQPKKTPSEKELAKIDNDTVVIENDELEYEIIIIEPGFNAWLVGTARPRGFYSQNFLETRNQQLVIFWNQRVLEPQRFNPNLYQLQINYQQGIDYGYEVNYMLYNYFIYFQLTFNQRLGPWLPRI